MERLGFGTLRLPMIQTEGKKKPDFVQIEEMVKTAVSEKILYFDCAPTYCDSQCEETIGHIVHNFRKHIYLASKIPLDALKKPGDLLRILKNTLNKLQTEYLDYYYFWGIKKKDYVNIALNNCFLEEMKQAKQEGLIRHMGFSFHDRPEYVIDIVNEANMRSCPFDMIMCQYNLVDRGMEPYFEFLKNQGLQIFVMGAAAGGKIDYQSSYSFVWKNPHVDCLVSGFQSLEMVKSTSRFLYKTNGLENSNIIKEKNVNNKLNDLYCTGCGYCIPCPQEIDIPRWMNIYQQKIVYDNCILAKKMRQMYLEENIHPNELCMDCGLCEKKCPQGLLIRNYIKEQIPL